MQSPTRSAAHRQRTLPARLSLPTSRHVRALSPLLLPIAKLVCTPHPLSRCCLFAMASSARDDFADSDAEHPDTHTRDTTFSSIERQSSSPSKRRRPSNQTPPPQVKRLKQESPSPIAPPVSISPQLWQHIFTFLPPESLAPVLRVNKLFFDLLTNPTLAPNDDQEPGRVSLRSPEAIWTISRKTYHPEWPEPLAGLPELTFWQLILRSTCQFCQRKLRAIYDTGSPWESGPGHDGISVVWQFGIRTCGPCLMERVQSVWSPVIAAHSTLSDGACLRNRLCCSPTTRRCCPLSPSHLSPPRTTPSPSRQCDQGSGFHPAWSLPNTTSHLISNKPRND